MFSDVETCIIDDRKSKKTNKPLMEKKRRARINHCLTELKEILIVDKHASAGHAKWEKADILEMTVEYMRKLRSARGLPMIPMHSAPAISLDDQLDASISHHVSPAPSTTSSIDTTPGEAAIAVTIVQPPASKRRRTIAEAPISSVPSTSMPLPMSTVVTSTPPHAPTPIMPNLTHPPLNFMAQQIMALQYHHQMKIAAAAPPMFPSGPGGLPNPVPLHMTQIPHFPLSAWRPV